jgi:hypothetical protein
MCSQGYYTVFSETTGKKKINFRNKNYNIKFFSLAINQAAFGPLPGHSANSLLDI